MKRLHSEKGFTLVELAIVMTIIGLLIGGILKGQTLMQNARVTAEVAQVKGVSAAMTTFKDMYNAVPGDMTGAGTRLTGCPSAAACNPSAATAGDGIVGNPGAAASTTWAAPLQTATAGNATPGTADGELYLFWSHLQLANLIGGVTADGLNTATNFAFDTTNPAVKLGGGLRVGYGNGSIPPGSTGLTAGTGLSGTVLIQVTGAQLSSALLTTVSTQALTPTLAAQVDRKMDDGRPGSGYVMAYGLPASCFSPNAPASAVEPQYLETVSTPDCGLMFRIEN